MHIQSLDIRNFRCFDTLQVPLGSPVTVIHGKNGSGKTSILEALHYLCYLRSFRTYTPKELLRFSADHFFVKASGFNQENTHILQVGFYNGVRRMRLDEKAIDSYKDLLRIYRVVTITEEDLALIKEGPEHRRAFLDTALLLTDDEYTREARSYKITLQQRNAFLRSHKPSGTTFTLWTEQLFDKTQHLISKRTMLLQVLIEQVNTLIAQFFPDEFTLCFSYVSQGGVQGFESFQSFNDTCGRKLYAQEERMQRSCFGAHLDDVSITFQDAVSRKYASRGQQKLIAILLKVALVMHIQKKYNINPVLLLDDFMTDFDTTRCVTVYAILRQLPHTQLIFTSPVAHSPFHEMASQDSCNFIKLP